MIRSEQHYQGSDSRRRAPEKHRFQAETRARRPSITEISSCKDTGRTLGTDSRNIAAKLPETTSLHLRLRDWAKINPPSFHDVIGQGKAVTYKAPLSILCLLAAGSQSTATARPSIPCAPEFIQADEPTGLVLFHLRRPPSRLTY